MDSDKPFIHDQAIVAATEIGNRSRIWAFVHVLDGARIGSDCNICDHVFIESDVQIGNRVTVKSGVQLWDGIRLADDVFVGPNVTFTNDRMPRSRNPNFVAVQTFVEKGASIGANATILPGLIIGEGAMIAAGSVVTRDVPTNVIVAGNPARILRTLDNQGKDKLVLTTLNDCRVLELSEHRDPRGTLVPMDSATDLPFKPTRAFILRDIANGTTRGEHAHRLSDEFVIPIQGAVTISLFDGERMESHRLDTYRRGIYLPPMIWIELSDFSADTIILALASRPYDRSEYIVDKLSFIAEKAKR